MVGIATRLPRRSILKEQGAGPNPAFHRFVRSTSPYPTAQALTQRPTVEFHPTMDEAIQAWSRISALDMITQRWRRAPLPILAPGPMTTLGPTRAVGSISAV